MDLNGLLRLANTEDGMLVADEDQRILVWNEGARAILGYEAVEVLGRHCHEVIPAQPGCADALCRVNCTPFQIARRGGAPATTVSRGRTRAGEERWLSLSHIAVTDDAGQTRMVHLFRDVSRAVEAEALLTRIAGFARERPPAPMPPPPPELLTPREREVLRLLAEGLGSRQIADRLVVSVSTARNHIQNILDRLGVHSRLEAVSVAHERGILPERDATLK